MDFITLDFFQMGFIQELKDPLERSSCDGPLPAYPYIQAADLVDNWRRVDLNV